MESSDFIRNIPNKSDRSVKSSTIVTQKGAPPSKILNYWPGGGAAQGIYRLVENQVVEIKKNRLV